MTEETPKKRKYTRHKVTSLPPSNLANAEIDSRLAQAIRDRAQAMQMVSKLVHWQDRLARLEQEINSLIGISQRMSGQVATDPTLSLLGPRTSVQITGYENPPSFSGHLAPIPDGVGSIPARQPKPTTPNQADVVSNEGGFS